MKDWSERRTFHPGSLPCHMAINVLDLDVTKNCNLRCTYCFKGETVGSRRPCMSLDVAMAAIDWLIAAAYSAEELWVNLMGGEPLLAFSLVKQLVPYAKRKAASYGKAVQFGCTTNLTLVNDEIGAFFREWGMGWHCSIDGPPCVQDVQRPAIGGKPSSTRAERGVSHVLKDRPGAMARATATPETVGHMLESVLYFEGLGFRNMGFALADENCWTTAHLAEFERQFELIRVHVRDNWYRKGVDREFGAFDYLIREHIAQTEHQFQCGAGRGTALIDDQGDIWPCHRWDGADLDSGSGGAWRFGNIFEDGFNHALHLALLERDRRACRKPECDSCAVRRICAGGCPAANLALTGTIYAQDETNCEAARIAFRHAMRLHDELLAEKNLLFMQKFYSKDYRPRDSFSGPQDITEPLSQNGASA